MNEMLFYGGIALTVITIIVAILLFLISKVKKAKLDAKLNSEYGKKNS